MFAATREIERAVSAPGTTLYVGFQRAEKLHGEASIYRHLTGQGVQVIAFGTGTPTQVPEVRWVRLPEDHGALANQWFLVTQTPEPIAFVGFEISPPDRIGVGGQPTPRGPGPALSATTRGWSGPSPATCTAWLSGRHPQPGTVIRQRRRRCCWSRPTTEPTRPTRCAAGPAWTWPGARGHGGPL
jgi:hypothetical protein